MKSIVIYFSAETGKTRAIAEELSVKLGADLFEIVPEQPYTVADMKIINPTDVDKILIQEGRDLLTLLTCHPYGTGGRYRLVVYCERNYD